MCTFTPSQVGRYEDRQVFISQVPRPTWTFKSVVEPDQVFMHSFSEDLLVTATTGDQPLQRNAAYQCDLTGVHWTDRKVMLRCCTVQVYAEAPRDQRSRAYSTETLSRAKHDRAKQSIFYSLPISSSLARTEPDTTRGLCQKQFRRGDLRHRFKGQFRERLLRSDF